MPTIGLDLSSEPNRPTGVGIYARALAEALSRADPPDLEVVALAPPGLEVSGPRLLATPFGESGGGWRRLYQQAVVPLRARLAGIDLLHSINNLGPVGWRGKRVLTFHDAKLYRSAQAASPLSRLYRRTLHRHSARAADLVIAVSEWAKREAASALGVDPARVRVIPHGIDSARFDPDLANPETDRRVLDRHGLGCKRFVLSVATREPAKNLPRALEAFAQVAPTDPDLWLVCCGGAGWGDQDLLGIAKRLGVASRLLLPGYVPHADLPALYRSADAFLFPSLVEGFGLPILEAFAAGTPVVTSTTSACPETAGGAALLADPTDVGEIAARLAQALEPGSRREEAVRRGRARAAEMTWERAARATLDVYRELLAPAPRRRLHIASLLRPETFYAPMDGGGVRDRAAIEHLAPRADTRVRYLARDAGYPLALSQFLAALLRERDARFLLLYPRLPVTLSRRFPHIVLRELFLACLRRAAERNEVIIDIHDLPVEQALDLGRDHGTRREDDDAYLSFERSLAKLPARFVFSSHTMARYMEEQRGLSPERVSVALNGATPPPPAGPSRLEAILQPPPRKDELLLCYVGVLAPGRSIEGMIQAVLAARRPLRLLLIGPSGEWLSDRPQDPRLHHLGHRSVESCQRIAMACDLGLIPYDPARRYMHIAYPSKLSFYLALGLPVLSTPVTEVQRVLTETGAGRCLPQERWTQCLEELTEAELAADSERARQVAERFTWARTLAGVLRPEADEPRSVAAHRSLPPASSPSLGAAPRGAEERSG